LVAECLKEVGVTTDVSPLLLNFRPDSTMQDRAAAARLAGRLTRDGNADGENDPTCAHHGITNTFEGGREAIDKDLRQEMSITDEQAESVASKVKAMRTCVGWFSSPACSLIYQVRRAPAPSPQPSPTPSPSPQPSPSRPRAALRRPRSVPPRAKR
jgi:hypothetical protein